MASNGNHNGTPRDDGRGMPLKRCQGHTNIHNPENEDPAEQDQQNAPPQNVPPQNAPEQNPIPPQHAQPQCSSLQDPQQVSIIIEQQELPAAEDVVDSFFIYYSFFLS